MAYILNESNQELIITLTAPYTNISRVLSFEDVLVYDSSIYFDLDKFFRFSFNNINYSNWMELSDMNLQFINIPTLSEFWIEYKYVLNYIDEGQSIEFKSIALEIINQQQKILKKDCSIVLNDECCVEKDAIVEECCPENLFNPYDIQNALNVYEPLVKLTSNIFGFEVEYYKTNPVANSKDVILKEYSLYNVEQKCNLKILIPDNALPTKELQFDSQSGATLPDMFEIHIVRSVFEDSFGVGQIPRINDYLNFPYLKRVFLVNSVMIADENPFNTANYYRVNLVDYSNKINMLDEEGISTDLNNQLDSIESVLGEQINKEIDQVVKPEQYETIAKQSDGSDINRAFIDPKVIIKDQNIINAKTYQVVSNHYYDFELFELPNQDAIIYKYEDGLPNDFAFTFMVRLTRSLTIRNLNVSIRKIEDTTGTYSNDYYNGIIIETTEPHTLLEGDFFNISNSSYYNGINIVSKVLDPNRIIVNKVYKGFNGGTINKIYEKQILIDNNDFSINLINSNIVVVINDKLLTFAYSYQIGYWSYNVLNFSNTFKQVAFFIYDSNFNKVYAKTNLIDLTVLNKASIKLKSGIHNITNIRLFNKNIEEEQQVSILSQNIVLDNQLALVIDNAQPQVRLKQYKNNR